MKFWCILNGILPLRNLFLNFKDDFSGVGRAAELVLSAFPNAVCMLNPYSPVLIALHILCGLYIAMIFWGILHISSIFQMRA